MVVVNLSFYVHVSPSIQSAIFFWQHVCRASIFLLFLRSRSRASWERKLFSSPPLRVFRFSLIPTTFLSEQENERGKLGKTVYYLKILMTHFLSINFSDIKKFSCYLFLFAFKSELLNFKWKYFYRISTGEVAKNFLKSAVRVGKLFFLVLITICLFLHEHEAETYQVSEWI